MVVIFLVFCLVVVGVMTRVMVFRADIKVVFLLFQVQIRVDFIILGKVRVLQLMKYIYIKKSESGYG